MARSRIIRPDLYRNERLVELDMTARYMAAGLVCWADKAGRLKDRPIRLKMEMFPADPIDVDELLDRMDKVGYIKRYSVNGERYIQIIQFNKHQNPHRQEKDSEIPPPPDELNEPVRNKVGTDSEHVRAQVGRRSEMGEKEKEQEKEKEKEQGKDCAKVIKSIITDDEPPDREKKKILKLEFERWWKVYPRKVSKKRCLAAWMSIKPEVEFVIADTLNRIKNDFKWQEKQFIPYPETYVRGERWEDEVEPIPKGQSSEETPLWQPDMTRLREFQIRFGADLVNRQLETDRYYSEEQFVKHLIQLTAH